MNVPSQERQFAKESGTKSLTHITQYFSFKPSVSHSLLKTVLRGERSTSASSFSPLPLLLITPTLLSFRFFFFFFFSLFYVCRHFSTRLTTLSSPLCIQTPFTMLCRSSFLRSLLVGCLFVFFVLNEGFLLFTSTLMSRE
jgi:hypothetical protein